MKKTLILILVVLVLVGIAYAMMTREEPREWTTRSADAQAEFELGLEALMKYYWDESAGHFRTAIELDPDFAAPKVMLLYTGFEPEQRDRFVGELRETELERLTERERFLVAFAVAKADQNTELADRLIEGYEATDPNDPFLLMTCSTEAWESRDWARAERHYRELIAADPNWVKAQNRLGYIAMAQGKFEEAEEAFRKYHYVAPDQANPHDSMGELMTLLGRYDEAQASFEKAIEIKPDFCLAYWHLADLFIMSGDFEPVPGVIDAAGVHCSPEFVHGLECQANLWKDFSTGDFEMAFLDDRRRCREQSIEHGSFILHLLALESGRFEIAAQTEAALRTALDKYEKDALEPNTDGTKGRLLHMEGARLAAQGDLEEAKAKLLRADDYLLYWGNGQGILKLYNLLTLSRLLNRTGDERAAQAIFEKVRSVNEPFAEMVMSDESPAVEMVADSGIAAP